MPETRLELRQTQKLSQSLQTVIRLLSLDLDGLSDYMIKAITDNPALEYVPPKKSAQDYAMHVKTYFRGGRGDNAGMEFVAAPVSALEELAEQLRFCRLDKPTAFAARQILMSLSSKGYFTQDLEGFAQEISVPLAAAKAALEAIQSLEPVGIGARSLEECLLLQLRERPEADSLCKTLVQSYLPEIGKRNYKKIAAETGASIAKIRRCIEVIRSLNPVPCSLDKQEVRYIMPEFSVEKDARGELMLLFHNDYYPTFQQDDSFTRLAGMLTDDDERKYAKKMLSSANQLIRAIEMRQTTMEKVARVIVREQRSFFLGEYSLVPLRIDEIAKEIGLHETTVYRAIQDKYLYCSRGTFPLNYFFQRTLSGGESPERVKEMIRSLCAERGKVSDRELAEALLEQGVQISRRTVAKYRSQIDINSSFYREAK